MADISLVDITEYAKAINVQLKIINNMDKGELPDKDAAIAACQSILKHGSNLLANAQALGFNTDTTPLIAPLKSPFDSGKLIDAGMTLGSLVTEIRHRNTITKITENESNAPSTGDDEVTRLIRERFNKHQSEFDAFAKAIDDDTAYSKKRLHELFSTRSIAKAIGCSARTVGKNKSYRERAKMIGLIKLDSGGARR